MTRSGIFGATALSLCLALAPALAQEHAGGRPTGARAGGNFGARTGGAPQANFRASQPSPQTNFRSGQANVGAAYYGRRNAQVAQQGSAQFAQPQPGGGGALRGGHEGEFRGGRDRGFARGAGIAAGVAAGAALAYGGYGYGYDPYYYGDSYAYDDGGYYDPGYAVAFGQPTVAVEAPVAGVPDAAGYCAQRFRSYDPASGTYLGFDGLRHPCP